MRRKLLIGCFVLAIFMAGYFVARYEAGLSKPAAVVQTDQCESNGEVSTIERKNGNLRLEQIKVMSKLPLPPANTPIAEIFDMLKKRADAGDGKAACRLSIELMRCRQAKNMSKYMLNSTDESYLYDLNYSEKQKLLIQNGQDEQRLKLIEKNIKCRNISDEHDKQTFKYLRQAAYSREPDALIPYIDGMGLTGLSAIRGGDFDIWRVDAVPFAELALRQGLPETVLLLSNGYSEDGAFFSSLVVDDPYQAEVMRQLYFRLFGIDPPDIKNNLSIEQNTQALIKSEKMFQDYFHGEVSIRSNSIKRLSAASSIESNLKAPCE